MPSVYDHPSSELLNLAACWGRTRALGPGLRFAVWVQGCPFHCPGCLAPEWIPQAPAELVGVPDLAERILSDRAVTGLTLSGGEPMLQAGALADLVSLVRQSRPALDVICFTGFRYQALVDTPPNAGVPLLLAQLDLLVDGPYVAQLNDDRGLRGSTNQNFIYLTSRLASLDFASQPRQVEVHLLEGAAFLVGVPPQRFLSAWEQALAASASLPQLAGVIP